MLESWIVCAGEGKACEAKLFDTAEPLKASTINDPTLSFCEANRAMNWIAYPGFGFNRHQAGIRSLSELLIAFMACGSQGNNEAFCFSI